MNKKALSAIVLLALMLSCGAVATIAPAKYRVAIENGDTFTDVIHYSWTGNKTELNLTRTEGQVEVIETTPDKVTIDRL